MKSFGNSTTIRAATAMFFLLVAVAAYYAWSGSRTLMSLRGKSLVGTDLLARWIDQHYVLRGRNPYDIYFAARDPAGPESYARSVGRDCTVDPELGVPWTEGYPPWSFVAGAAFFGPPWSVMLPYSLALNLIGLAIIAGWAYRLGGGGPRGALFAAACLACNGYAVTIATGQTVVFIVAALAVAHWLAERGHPWASGVLLGVAMFKHTIAGPFLLCFLVRGQWKPIASCLAYLGLASALAWVATATGPLEMMSQMMRAAQVYLGDGSGPINLLIDAGVDPKVTLLGMAAGSVILATALMWALRHGSLLTLFAVAAVCSRTWTYHRSYDDPTMVFLLLAIGLLASRTRDPLDWILFFLVSLTLWLPPRHFSKPMVTSGQFVVWVVAVARLVADHVSAAASRETPEVNSRGEPRPEEASLQAGLNRA